MVTHLMGRVCGKPERWPLPYRASCSVIIRSHHVTIAADYELREPKMSTGGRREAEKLTLSVETSRFERRRPNTSKC